jgi:hypothetical protein
MEEADRLTRAVLSRAQSLDDYRDGGGGERGEIAVLLPPPSTDMRACNVGVEYVSFFQLLCIKHF